MALSKNDDATFETILNQVEHEFEIYLDFGAGEDDDRIYPINPNAIVNLTIEDSLSNWIVRGSLTIFHNPEIQDEVYNASIGNYVDSAENINAVQDKSSYPFRNDGWDLLRVRLKPKVSGNETSEPALSISDTKHWSMSYLFSIYDIEDIDLPPGAQNQASNTIKCLKLYFWDSWYQKMLSNTLSYSTGLSNKADAEADIQEGIVDNPGTIYTGDAIKDIINLGLEKDPNQEKYGDTYSVDPVLQCTYNPIDEEDWDTGASKIFYTAPVGTTAHESLEYLEKKHVSTVSIASKSGQNDLSTQQETTINDVCLLLKERGPTEYDIGQFVLRPFSDFFDKAGSELTSPKEYQIEHFYVQSYGYAENNPTLTFRGPYNTSNSDTIDFSSPKFSIITSYRFVDISALTNTEDFTNKPVHSFNFKNRVFNIEFQNNSVTTAREFMNKKYIDPLYTKSSPNDDSLFLITLNKDKEKANTRPVFSLHGDLPLLRQAEGFHKLLKTGVFLNTAINFRVLGLTNREPGRFVAIDRIIGAVDGDFENKFYGQWFTINVRHIIEAGVYYNDITAVKIHRYGPLLNGPPGDSTI